MFDLAQEIRSNYEFFVCKSRVHWKSRTNCIYLEILPGISDLPSIICSLVTAVSGQGSLKSLWLSVKTGGIPRVEWGMYKIALVAALQKMM